MSEDQATRADKPARPSQPAFPDFGARYRVIGVLGKGGMGEVYRAYDAELKVEVALKVVRGDHEEAIGRFRREVALARKVTSPHVLRIYDIEEHDGIRFLSMEFVDGEDLAAIMRREGRLPVTSMPSLERSGSRVTTRARRLTSSERWRSIQSSPWLTSTSRSSIEISCGRSRRANTSSSGCAGSIASENAIG
jgi:hypothetical protein